MLPRILTPEQKEIWMNICAYMLQNIEKTQTFSYRACSVQTNWRKERVI
jgi:hypothetical protein